MAQLAATRPTSEDVHFEPTGAAWRRAAVRAFGSWLAANVAYVITTVYVWRITKVPAPHMADIGATWDRQDATYYTAIASLGYHNAYGSPAFYPLYPMTVRVADWFAPGGVLIAAMGVASLCAFGTFVLLHRFVEEEFDEKVAGRSIVFLAAFPMAFFLFGAYNESMFLLLTVGALYAARRSNWWLAGTLTSLAGATRLFGLLLAIPLAYEYLRQRGWRLGRIRWDILSFAIMPLGIFAYAVYCRVSFGSWLHFLKVQDNWDRSYGWPFESLYHAIRVIGTMPFLNEWHLLTLFEAASVVFALVLLVLGFVGPWRFRTDQFFLPISAVLPVILISTTMTGENRWLTSAPRYVMEFVPIFIVLARMGRNQAFEKTYVAAGYMLQALLLGVFLLDVTFVA